MLTGKWQQVLAIKRKTNVQGFNFDLQKTSGFYNTFYLDPRAFSCVFKDVPQHVVCRC
jgi:hypothetical protein